LALIDQAVVSGASFTSTVIVGRWTSSSELGTYSIGMSILLSLVATQESLIAWPYTIQRHQPQGSPTEHTGAFLLQNDFLSALTTIALVLAACGLIAKGTGQHLIALLWALAVATPFGLLREFARRTGFANLQMKQPLILDGAAAIVQIFGLGLLARTGQLSAVTACAAIGAARAVTGSAWLYLTRKNFVLRWHRVRATMHSSWRLAKWLFANEMTLSVQSYVGYWILAWTNGMAAAGVYTACMSISQLSNPFILGSSNFLVPRAALAWAEGGREGLRRHAVHAMMPLAAGMIVFCVVVFSAGDVLMQMLYPAEEYAGQGDTINVLAVAMLAVALGLPATSALTSMERPYMVFWAGLGGVGLTGALVWWLASEWRLIGAAYGFVAGSFVRSAAYWGLFLTATSQTGPKPHPAVRARPAPDLEAVASVLRKVSRVLDNDGWVLEKLGEGWQSIVYRVRHSDHRRPVWLNERSLAVKLYKRETDREGREARREFQSLRRLYQAVNGRTINGWKICSPRRLCLCPSPLAIVMSIVPGRKLNDVLEAGECPPEVMTSLPRAITFAMTRFWLGGKLFGDLNLDNMLCSAGTREIGFVDPILPPDETLSDAVPRAWYPGSHDLARLLYETAVRVRAYPGSGRGRQRKATFVASVLRTCVGTIAAPDDRRSLFDEIQIGARGYLEALKPSLSLRGAWHAVLRPMAAIRIAEMVSTASWDAACSDGRGIPVPGSAIRTAQVEMDQECRKRCKA
jgi:O-antigen/teichoic acid export membrane protein